MLSCLNANGRAKICSQHLVRLESHRCARQRSLVWKTVPHTWQIPSASTASHVCLQRFPGCEADTTLAAAVLRYRCAEVLRRSICGASVATRLVKEYGARDGAPSHRLFDNEVRLVLSASRWIRQTGAQRHLLVCDAQVLHQLLCPREAFAAEPTG